VARIGRLIRIAALAATALLPGLLKRAVYRFVFGYRIGARVRIGLTLLDAEQVELGEGTRIGHLNLVTSVKRFTTGACADVGWLNILRGGEVRLGDYAQVIRLNVLNAIPDHDCTTAPESVLDLGAGAVVTSGHRLDFTDRITLGRNVIVGGRNSSLWTHNRQETAPIVVGDFCYLGSEVRLAPGARLPGDCVLGIGSVLVAWIEAPGSLVAGVPAKVVRPLDENAIRRNRRKTRREMPDDYYDRPTAVAG
jgi:acetyltransferase-like isoleucine patch superfamily enzyme